MQLFTAANINCREAAQLQKDLIGNEGFCSLPCCQCRTHTLAWTLEAGSIASSGLTLREEVFFVRWRKTFNSAGVCIGHRLCLIWQFKISHHQNFFFGEGQQNFVVYGDSVQQSWSAVLHTVHMKTLLIHKRTNELIKAERSKCDSNFSLPLLTYLFFSIIFIHLNSTYSSFRVLISPTRKTSPTDSQSASKRHHLILDFALAYSKIKAFKVSYCSVERWGFWCLCLPSVHDTVSDRHKANKL